MNDSMNATKPKIIHQKIPWPGGPSIPQCFPFPSTIIYYITQNPSSPKCYSKMIQSCKYFFEKNPILVIKQMYEKIICSNDLETCRTNHNQCCININLTNFISKIWLIHQFRCCFYENPNFISLICPKIYKCEIEDLQINGRNGRIVLFDDFQILIPSVKFVSLSNLKMIDNQGNNLVLEKIMEAIPNIEKFEIKFGSNFSMLSTSTLKNITTLQNLRNLKKISFIYLHEIFPVDDLSNFITNYKDTAITIFFIPGFSDEYKNQIDALIDNIIGSEVPNRDLLYYGIDEEKYELLKNRCC